MDFGWQDAMALAIVAAAAGYLVRQAWRSLKGKRVSGCSGCPNSGCTTGSNAPALVSLDTSPPAAGRQLL